MKKEANSITLNRDVITIQLLEVAISLIKQIKKYAEENGIILSENPKLNMLLNEAKTLLEEDVYISEKITSKFFIRRFFTREKSDEDFTEPTRIKVNREDRLSRAKQLGAYKEGKTDHRWFYLFYGNSN
jgi:hypothetical protein